MILLRIIVNHVGSFMSPYFLSGETKRKLLLFFFAYRPVMKVERAGKKGF